MEKSLAPWFRIMIYLSLVLTVILILLLPRDLLSTEDSLEAGIGNMVAAVSKLLTLWMFLELNDVLFNAVL